MKVLVIGKGGREDALVWKIGKSPLCEKIYCLPGNDGICEREKTTCFPIDTEDIFELLNFAKKEKIDLTVVGPEAPLVKGIVDLFEKEGLKIFGPKKQAAKLEGSKIFAKNFMKKYKIPTAQFETFDDYQKAEKFALSHLPCVIKVDGLAGGKGAIICLEKEKVKKAIEKVMIKKEFGKAGEKVVIEEFLRGQEVSFFILTDGKKFINLLPVQDHKALYDGDKGPNTGGMGCFCPFHLDEKTQEKIIKEIVEPTLEGLKKEKIEYKGCLYFGLMLTKEGPKVLEYNCRFGDPELEPQVLLMKSDLLTILEKVAKGNLEDEIEWEKKYAVCVILASGGYPQSYEKGKEIKGIEEVEKMENVVLFKCGVKKEKGVFKTAGGRVLAVTAKAEKLEKAIELAYKGVEKISFEKMHFRKDIGKRGLSYSLC